MPEQDTISKSDSPEIVQEQSEVVAASNLKVTGEGPAFYGNLAYGNAIANQQMAQQNALAHQQAMNNLAAAVIGKVTEMVIHTSPSEGAIDMATIGQLAKLLQLTPPQA